jgi:type II secretory pathway pseudopilin PulG
MNRTSGFSLIELLGAMTAAMVIAAITIPSLTRASRSYKLTSLAHEVEGQLQNTRFAAINHNKSASLLFSSGGDWYFLDTDANGVVSGTETPMWVTQSGFSLNCASPSPSLTGSVLGTSADPVLLPNRGLAFTPRGIVVQVSSSQVPTASRMPAPGVVYIRDPNGDYAAVTITPAGRIRSWLLKGTTWR